MLLMAGAILVMFLGAVAVKAGPSDAAAWEVEAAEDKAMAAELAADVELAERMGSATVTVQEDLPTFSAAGEKLVVRMAEGFLRKTRKESKQWWKCGVSTPEDEQPARADLLARHVLAGMREYNINWIPAWAVMGTIWSESRGDSCAIGPNSRKAARGLGLVPADRIFNRWTADDVKAVMEDPKWKKARAHIGADLGLGQQVWERYARIIDPMGNKKCGIGFYCRVPTLDEILSDRDGAKAVITGMVYRRFMYRSLEPWAFWPGNVRSLSYEMKIARIVQEMGGDIREQTVW
jgi:hypothetical protein